MENNFDLILKQLEKEKENFINKINDKTINIKIAEKALTDMNINFPGTISFTNFTLSWDLLSEKSKTFRIIYEDKDIRRPLIETPLEIRLRVVDSLDEFLEGYLNFLKEYM